jgi:MrcB-like, N-terminal domain
VPLGIAEGLQRILDRYAETPPGTPWPTSHPVRKIFSELVDTLKQSGPLAKRQTLNTRIAGLGRQASLAWIGFLDSRETTTPRNGAYCVYLFREDLFRVGT